MTKGEAKAEHNSQDHRRWARVFGFAILYFVIFVTSAIFLLVRSYLGSPELEYYLQNPWIALRTIIDFAVYEIPQSPFLLFTVVTLILQSLFLGWLTDWGLRRIKNRKLKTESKEIKTDQEQY